MREIGGYTRSEMKLRFRSNTLRLRVNRREVDTLAAGEALREQVIFPDNAQFTYVLEPLEQTAPRATFQKGVIVVTAPITEVQSWAHSETIGLYFELPADGATLQVAIEKDLECVDGPPEERDPEAFARTAGKTC
jgi:hypothetical protein